MRPTRDGPAVLPRLRFRPPRDPPGQPAPGTPHAPASFLRVFSPARREKHPPSGAGERRGGRLDLAKAAGLEPSGRGGNGGRGCSEVLL